MDSQEIKRVVAEVLPLSKQQGDAAKKKTIPGTFHVGDLTGNRLNSGTLRSQFIICESESVWKGSAVNAQRALHSDQRVFVQTGDDVWDVYGGATLESESNDPIQVARSASGLKVLLQEAQAELRSSPYSPANSANVAGPRQLIFYGAPGTGKSHQTDAIVKKYSDTIRVTFHPDSDYASFVGCYKPTMEPRTKYGLQGQPIKVNGSDLQEDVIVYRFVPQAFTKAYELAWRKMAECKEGEYPAPQFLVTEEINRGNCAQIFGDLFQLLDRDDAGYSKYPVDPDADFAKHLHGWFRGGCANGDGTQSPNVVAAIDDAAKARKAGSSDSDATWADVLSGRKLVLPPNLYIWATMNTSDQSLFPMDSAFKRRWDWKYVPITDAKKGWEIVAGNKRFDWWSFLKKANKAIRKATGSEDKELGYYFVKPPKDLTDISAETFVDKVLFYLFGDAFKDDTPPLSLFPKKTDGSEPWTLRDFRECVLEDGSAKAKPNEKNLAAWLEKILNEPPKGRADLFPDGGDAADNGGDAAGSDNAAAADDGGFSEA